MHAVLGRLGSGTVLHERQLAGLEGSSGGSITTSSGSSKVTGHASVPDQNRPARRGRRRQRRDGPDESASAPRGSPNVSDNRRRSTSSPRHAQPGIRSMQKWGVLDQDSAVTRLSRPCRACRPGTASPRLRATRAPGASPSWVMSTSSTSKRRPGRCQPGGGESTKPGPGPVTGRVLDLMEDREPRGCLAGWPQPAPGGVMTDQTAMPTAASTGSTAPGGRRAGWVRPSRPGRWPSTCRSRTVRQSRGR